MKSLFPFVLLFTFCACQSKNPTRVLAEQYFDVYAERSDWQGFQDLFAHELIFEDVIFDHEKNKEEFVSFYNWPDTLFAKHPDYPKSLVLDKLAITNNTAVGSGYFTPFYYAGELMADITPWRFTIWLTFNDAGLITKQVDWIAYPPEFLKLAAEQRMSKQD